VRNGSSTRSTSRRVARIAAVALSAGLPALAVSGVADAETTSTPPVPTVSVEGVASVPVSQTADQAAATAAYREAMAAAILDGQSKATFLASKVGAAVGAAQGVIEGGGSIECTSKNSEGETSYENYEGAQPDFGSGQSSVLPVAYQHASEVSTGAPTVGTAKPGKTTKHHKRKHAHAKKASATTCTLSTSVSLIYAIS
jgi:hypothetical protein